ncbi:hypothetical protein C8F04DRAFT_1110208 [Mycena alexandri]|uniref:Uncharacterized protein n=1 Tax=Mycena alexandri TaxID=1745969 RepID=A0AAD6X4B3_9AGAR|nr:hypothetical protein C8F04DRAFT_1110208 [Mycena alexandri]
MHFYKLALPLALVWGATAAYAYPAAFQNPESPALVVRAEHALPSPYMAMSYPVTNTAGPDPQSLNMPRSFEDSSTKVDQKRQIHNADYHANSPPPSPNPASDEDSSSPSSPTDSPAASPSETVPQDKGRESSFKHGPGPVVRPPSSSQETGSNGQGDVEKNSDTPSMDGPTVAAERTGTEREQKRQIHNADYSNAPPPSPNPAVDQDSSSPPSPPTSPDASSEAGTEREQKRQIHNADYSNAPPPSPNPAVDQDSSSPPSPPASPNAAASDTATKAKRAMTPREHSVVPSSSISRENGNQDHPNVQSSSVATERRWIDAFDIISRDAEWYGRSRRNVEELTNINNRSLDHKAVLRWTRAEAAKMQAWSKSKFAR